MLEYDSPISQKPGGRALSLIQRRFCANSINLLLGGKQRLRVPAEPPPQKILPSSSMAPSSTKPDPPPFPSSAAFLPVMWEGAGVEAFCRSRGFTGAGGHARARALEKKLASKKILQQIWPQTSSWLDLKKKNPPMKRWLDTHRPTK